jgi:hypothetical protein
MKNFIHLLIIDGYRLIDFFSTHSLLPSAVVGWVEELVDNESARSGILMDCAAQMKDGF